MSILSSIFPHKPPLKTRVLVYFIILFSFQSLFKPIFSNPLPDNKDSAPIKIQVVSGPVSGNCADVPNTAPGRGVEIGAVTDAPKTVPVFAMVGDESDEELLELEDEDVFELLELGVEVGVTVGVEDGAGEGVGVDEGVGDGVGVGVDSGLEVGADVGDEDGSGVGVADAVGVGDGVAEGAGVDEGVGVGEGVVEGLGVE